MVMTASSTSCRLDTFVALLTDVQSLLFPERVCSLAACLVGAGNVDGNRMAAVNKVVGAGKGRGYWRCSDRLLMDHS